MTTLQRRQLPKNFDQLHLTQADFHACYTLFTGLRFPLDVSEVLDVRCLINEAADQFAEPPLTPDYRQFRESLELMLDAAAIESPIHRERMLKIFAMMRELHLAHVFNSRTAEEKLRLRIDENRVTRRKALRSGITFVLGCIVTTLGWFALPEFAWAAKIASLLFAIHAFRSFRMLPRLDQESQALRQQFNDVLRERVDSVDWKVLVHKLSLVLGFKKQKGIQVFLGDAMTDSWRFSRTIH